jgi:hypothetical protein
MLARKIAQTATTTTGEPVSRQLPLTAKSPFRRDAESISIEKTPAMMGVVSAPMKPSGTAKDSRSVRKRSSATTRTVNVGANSAALRSRGPAYAHRPVTVAGSHSRT